MMNARQMTMTLLVVAAVIVFVPTAANAASPKRANIVLIPANDLGYGDANSRGATKIRDPGTKFEKNMKADIAIRSRLPHAVDRLAETPKAAMLTVLTSGLAEAETPLQQAAMRVAKGLADGDINVSGYRESLALEAVLRWGRASGREQQVQWVLDTAAERGLKPGSETNRRRDPFNCLVFWLYREMGDDSWLPGFVLQTKTYRAQVSRSPEGAIEHPRGAKRGGGQAMLIDALQDYSSRMAMLGQVTGDVSAFAEAVAQYRIYRQVVRDPESGLWCQGRGWREDRNELSPGHWSRGHGWLIRGMVDTLLLLPRESAEARELRGYLKELADALLRVQQPDGMWHCLMNRPPSKSPPEVSGTALIAGNLAIAVVEGFLQTDGYEAAARRAFTALPPFVDAQGQVQSVSPGPGPLSEEEPWITDAFEPGDEHGPFAILFAALGEKLLDAADVRCKNSRR